MLNFLHYFFLFFHTFIILFNLFGWIHPKTRKANLILLMLTAGSWFGLGIWYGIGYCPCTDWHWQVLREMGKTQLPSSYIQYLLITFTGIRLSAEVVNYLTLAGFFIALAISVFLNVRDYRRKRKSAEI